MLSLRVTVTLETYGRIAVPPDTLIFSFHGPTDQPSLISFPISFPFRTTIWLLAFSLHRPPRQADSSAPPPSAGRRPSRPRSPRRDSMPCEVRVSSHHPSSLRARVFCPHIRRPPPARQLGPAPTLASGRQVEAPP